MKVAVCSDLHLEFQDINIPNTEGAQVLILSGDILVEQDLDMYDRRQVEMGFARERSVRLHEFFSRVCFQFPHVLYVAGNHEHYHGDFAHTVNELKRKLGYFKNLHILDKEVFRLEDYVFVGSTLWTDMNKEDPLTLFHIKQMMNDFKIIKNSDTVVHFKGEDGKMHTRGAKFSPQDAVDEHKKCLDYVKFVVSEAKPHEKVVVVGHHTPSLRSCAEHYKHDTMMNGGYHSSLDEYIMDHPQIVLWTHGHTHENMDYMIGDTRVFCNPRGYAGWDDTASSFELKVIEV